MRMVFEFIASPPPHPPTAAQWAPPSPTRGEGSWLEPQLPRGEVAHDFFGAAADGVDADLAVDALDLGAAHEAGAAEDLHRFARTELHGERRLVLEHADIGHRIFTPIDAPGGALEIGLRGIDAH